MEIEKMESFVQTIKSEDDKSKEEFKPEPVKGAVGKKKQTLAGRFKEEFFKTSLKDVKNRMFEEVIMPGIKDLVYDFIVMGVGVWFFDNARGGRKTQSSNGSYTSYGGWSRGEPERPSKQTQRRSSQVADYWVESNDERQYIISMLFEYLDKYNKVQVANYYQLLNMEVKDTDWNWGWRSLNDLNTYERREYDDNAKKYVTHFYIHMPNVESLK